MKHLMLYDLVLIQRIAQRNPPLLVVVRKVPVRIYPTVALISLSLGTDAVVMMLLLATAVFFVSSCSTFVQTPND